MQSNLIAYDDNKNIIASMQLDITEKEFNSISLFRNENNIICLDKHYIKGQIRCIYNIHTTKIRPYNKYDARILVSIYEYIDKNYNFSDYEKIEDIMLDMKDKYRYNVNNDTLSNYNFYAETRYISELYRFLNEFSNYNFGVLIEEVDLYARQ